MKIIGGTRKACNRVGINLKTFSLMGKLEISNETMQKLESLKNSLSCGNTENSLYGNPTACTSCWGGGCANGFTG